MIHKFRIGNLRINEFIGFHKSVYTILVQNDVEALNVEQAATIHFGKTAELEELYKMNAFNPITAELEEVDHQRDEVYNGIFNLLNGNANHFVPAKREAAHLLLKDLEKYGIGFVRGNYNAETIDLQNIIADWRTKTELMGAVTALGIVDWVNELERLNQLFDTKYIARTSSNAAKSDETATAKRAEVMVAYDSLCNYLNSYSFINDTPEYRTVISELNELIDQFSTLLKQRRGRAESAKKAPEVQ